MIGPEVQIGDVLVADDPARYAVDHHSFANHHLLEPGQSYKVVGKEVHGWSTVVWLEGFGDKEFNTAGFKDPVEESMPDTSIEIWFDESKGEWGGMIMQGESGSIMLETSSPDRRDVTERIALYLIRETLND